jgi:hypothetical protein
VYDEALWVMVVLCVQMRRQEGQIYQLLDQCRFLVRWGDESLRMGEVEDGEWERPLSCSELHLRIGERGVQARRAIPDNTGATDRDLFFDMPTYVLWADHYNRRA